MPVAPFLARLLLALCLSGAAHPSAAGPLADRLARLGGGEEIPAVTLLREDFEASGYRSKLAALFDDLGARDDLGAYELVIACHVGEDPEEGVRDCNAWMGRISPLVGELTGPGGGPARIAPRIVPPEARGSGDGRAIAIEVALARAEGDGRRAPSSVAFAQPPVAPADPVEADPDPDGYWNARNAALKLATQGVQLSPRLAAPRTTLVEPGRPAPRAATLEFWMSVDPTRSFDAPMALAALGDAGGVVFSVHVDSDLGRIGAWFGSGPIRWVDAPFERGRPYHVAVRTRFGETRFAVDGEAVGGTLDTGLGGGEAGGRQAHLRDPARGQARRAELARPWQEALRQQDGFLLRARRRQAAPPAQPELSAPVGGPPLRPRGGVSPPRSPVPRGAPPTVGQLAAPGAVPGGRAGACRGAIRRSRGNARRAGRHRAAAAISPRRSSRRCRSIRRPCGPARRRSS